MKFLIKLILSVVLTLVLSMWLPFWAPAIGIILINYFIKSSGWSSFFSGFLGMGLTWLVYAWMLSTGEANVINEKMAEIFMGLSPEIMFIISGLIGGITGGISAVIGFLFQPAVKVNMSNNPYH